MSDPQPYSPSSSSSPLDAPLYGASLPDAVRRFFGKYATFTGRASRSEYWWWVLVNVVVVFVLEIIAVAAGGSAMMMGSMGSSMGTSSMSAGGAIVGVVLLIWGLGTIVPNLALAVRRLHDANYSGFYYFLVLIPFVGSIIILVFTLLASNPAGARFDVVRGAAPVA